MALIQRDRKNRSGLLQVMADPLNAFLGWGVSEAMSAATRFILRRLQDINNWPQECTELSDVLRHPNMQRMLAALDKFTDDLAPDRKSRRDNFVELCDDLAEAQYLLYCLSSVAIQEQQRKPDRERLPRMKRAAAAFASKARCVGQSLRHAPLQRDCPSTKVAALREKLEENYIRLESMPTQAALNVKNRDHQSTLVISSARRPDLTMKLDPPSDSFKEEVRKASGIPDLLDVKGISQHGSRLVKQINQKLEKNRNVAIVGMGGIGKTSIARAVFEQAAASKRFTKMVWLTLGQNASVYDRLRNAFDQLFNTGSKQFEYDFSDELSGLHNLLLRLRNHSVMLVLDDVWLECGSNAAIIEAVNFATCPQMQHDRSRLIVTTRQESVLSCKSLLQFATLHMPVLDAAAAGDLCNHYLSASPDTPPRRGLTEAQLPSLVPSLIAVSAGSPLTLTDICRFVQKRGCGSHSRVTQCLIDFRALRERGEDATTKELVKSIDALPPSLQDCFIHFAAFRKGELVPEERLQQLFATHAPLYSPASLQAAAEKLKELVRHSVVSPSTQAGRPVYSLHPIFYDIALRRSCEHRSVRCFHAQNSHQHCRELTIYSSSIRFFSCDGPASLPAAVQQCNHGVDSLRMCMVRDSRPGETQEQWPSMRRLRYLHVGGDLVALRDSAGHWNLPDTPRHMLNYLCMSGYVQDDLQDMFSRLLPPASCSLLAHLDLSGCSALQQLPDSISSCSQLQHLNLSGCTRLEELTTEIIHCSHLTHLDLSGCGRVDGVPERVYQCQSLQHLSLSGCTIDQEPRGLGKCNHLTHLDLSTCLLNHLPDSITQCTGLVHLNLSSCYVLMSLPQSFRDCKELKHIDLSGCTELQAIAFAGCCKLEHLNLFRCSKVVKIDLKGCAGLADMRCGDFQFSHLEEVDVSSCEALLELPGNFGHCKKHLDVRGCKKLIKLPRSLKHCSKLKILHDNWICWLQWQVDDAYTAAIVAAVVIAVVVALTVRQCMPLA